MKIIQLKAENLKRLKAVEISPDGNIVEITGRNGQGKSSVLDAIWWAVGGATHIQAVPIRKGENEARIRLDLGEIRVIRTFKKREGAGGYTTQIVVENAEGARYPSPQKLLDALLGELSFDPLAFTRKDPNAQFEALKRFVPGVDFDAIDRLNRADFERRTEINRQARALRNQVSGFDLPEEIPAERADVSALVADLERVGEHNAALERRRARRQQTLSDAQARRAAAGEHRARAEEHRRLAQEADAEADRAEAAAAEAHRMLDEAPPLPDPLDASEVRHRIEAAQAANRVFDLAEQRAELAAKAERAEREASDLTQAMAERESSKRAAIAAAAMPVDGLGFGDGEILLNGVPFEQASSAEQLRTSVAIAMAANPKLRVLRVQDGSLLDDEAMRILAEMAAAADYQIWIEVVQSGRSAAVVIEDGEVRGAVAAVAAE